MRRAKKELGDVLRQLSVQPKQGSDTKGRPELSAAVTPVVWACASGKGGARGGGYGGGRAAGNPNDAQVRRPCVALDKLVVRGEGGRFASGGALACTRPLQQQQGGHAPIQRSLGASCYGCLWNMVRCLSAPGSRQPKRAVLSRMAPYATQAFGGLDAAVFDIILPHSLDDGVVACMICDGGGADSNGPAEREGSSVQTTGGEAARRQPAPESRATPEQDLAFPP